MFLLSRGLALGAGLPAGLAFLFAGTAELGRLFRVEWPLRSVLGDSNGALTLPAARERRPLEHGRAVRALRPPPSHPIRERPGSAPAPRRPRMDVVVAPLLRHPPVAGPATGSPRPVAPAPQAPPQAPAAPAPDGGGSTSRLTARAHLSLTRIELGDAPQATTGSRLLMHFAVRDLGDQGGQISSPAPLPSQVVVTVTMPDVAAGVATSSALRLSVDLLDRSDSSATAPEVAAPDGAAVRVRLAVVDGAVDAPVAAEGPATADGASNTVEVLAPLPAPDPGSTDGTTGTGDPPADPSPGSGPGAGGDGATGLAVPLASDAQQVLIPVAPIDAPPSSETLTVDVPPAPADPAGAIPDSSPPMTVTIGVEAPPAPPDPPADTPAPTIG
jgi:hypothetical protein